MTRAEAIAEAERRQASDLDASWIAASRGGAWTVVRIVKHEAPRPELRRCPFCNGAGLVKLTQDDPQQCNECNGTGELPAVNQAGRSRSSGLSSGIWGWAPPGGLG
jgi:hypothetical protein